MLISLAIFAAVMKRLPDPAKKEKAAVKASSQEIQNDATEIKQRMYALYAVLGIAVFFWFSFHRPAHALAVFARDFVATDAFPP